MSSIKDDRGYNQVFKPSKALEIRTARRCDYIDSQITKRPGVSILEIGCGTGELSYLLAKKTDGSVFGTDLCLPFIEAAQKNYSLKNLEFAIFDFNDAKNNKYSFFDKKFDYIVGNGILHHLYYDLDKTLESLSSLLKSGGKIIFLEPNLLNPYCFLIFKFKLLRKLAKLEPAEMAFTKQFISEKLEKHNFNDISVNYKDFLLPNTPSFLIKPVILLGDLLERTPLFRTLSQSIYIMAKKGGAEINIMKESFRPVKNRAPTEGTFEKIKFKLRLVLDLQNKTIYKDLKTFLAGVSGTVLDIGCGDGPYKHLLNKKCEYIGLDIENHENFDYQNKGILFFNGYDIPLSNESVDYFICTEVLEHVEYPKKLIEDIYRVLRSGGEGIITVPFSARYHYIPFDYFRYTPTAL